jgi:hypothetical protein
MEIDKINLSPFSQTLILYKPLCSGYLSLRKLQFSLTFNCFKYELNYAPIFMVFGRYPVLAISA